MVAHEEELWMIGNGRGFAGSMLRVVVAIGLGVSALACSAPELPPRNIVLITIDTLRADHLGTYG